ncbi:MAG: hypothetical protein V3R49_05780 [Gammaproteobacteria bacterium]
MARFAWEILEASFLAFWLPGDENYIVTVVRRLAGGNHTIKPKLTRLS